MNTIDVSLFKAGYCVHPECVAIRGGRLRLRNFPAIVGLVKHPQHGFILFDTGYTQRFFRETATGLFSLYGKITPVSLQADESVARQLCAVGIQPEEIRYIFLSHFHADHIGGCRDFPRAVFIVMQEAYDAVKDLNGIKALRAGYIKNLLPKDFNRRVRLIGNSAFVKLSSAYLPFLYGADIFADASLFAVQLPGHAPGQMGLLIPQSSNGRYFFVGDACWLKRSYLEFLPPNSVARIIMADWDAYKKTLQHIHLYAKGNPGVKIIPSHCLETWEALADVAKY